MVNCGNQLMVMALVALSLVTLVHCGPGEKLATCCKSVTRKEIREEITGFMVQEENLPCVKAVIFQTKSGIYCAQGTAPWVFKKITEFRRARKMAAAAASAVPTTRVSLLSIITSTASPSSSSSSSSIPPSSSSTSEMPVATTSTSN